ncbi:hypothetical protein R1T08_15095 [Streptomyces sp. SBC-4]|nr:hypothetical protein [Streptomyces sp. SBC-4]MDV5145504.1 hypothetical protein [Streptomyces sp. SBC-4]
MNELLSNPIIGLVIGLVLAEVTEIAPWTARMVLRFAARRLGDPEATARYEEEWAALLDQRPGKLLKLVYAISILVFATPGLRRSVRPRRTRHNRTERWSPRLQPGALADRLAEQHSAIMRDFDAASWRVEGVKLDFSRTHWLGIAASSWLLLISYSTLMCDVHDLVTMSAWLSDVAFVTSAASMAAALGFVAHMTRNKTYTIEIEHTSGARIAVSRVALYSYPWPHVIKSFVKSEL